MNIPEHLKKYYNKEYPCSKNANSDILAQILSLGNDDPVSRLAVLNPNCPSKILSKILKRENNDEMEYFAAFNPNCPPEALAEVLKRGGGDWVSRRAARNPNCPIRAKLQWMMDTGKIKQEDPEIHKKDEVDTGLIKFEELLES